MAQTLTMQENTRPGGEGGWLRTMTVEEVAAWNRRRLEHPNGNPAEAATAEAL